MTSVPGRFPRRFCLTLVDNFVELRAFRDSFLKGELTAAESTKFPTKLPTKEKKHKAPGRTAASGTHPGLRSAQIKVAWSTGRTGFGLAPPAVSREELQRG